MVAKINRGVSLYGAIIYNQQKVDDATARIIYGNRMIADVAGTPEQVVRQTMWAFENYLLANRNTEKPILHISLNPSLDDRLTDGQFAELAKEYMQKMGYGDQPYIVYVHEDIDRRHIHIVSTCVNERCLRVEPLDESLPGTGTEVRIKTGGGQTERIVGAIPQERGLPKRECEGTGFIL